MRERPEGAVRVPTPALTLLLEGPPEHSSGSAPSRAQTPASPPGATSSISWSCSGSELAVHGSALADAGPTVDPGLVCGQDWIVDLDGRNGLSGRVGCAGHGPGRKGEGRS
jgi:hypothetical protein